MVLNKNIKVSNETINIWKDLLNVLSDKFNVPCTMVTKLSNNDKSGLFE